MDRGAVDVPTAPPLEPLAPSEEGYRVMAKSFLLGSTIDLESLRPRFEDVLRAHGKDYLMLAVTPRDGAPPHTRNVPSGEG